VVNLPCDLDGADPELINPLATVPGTHKKAIVRNAKAKMIEGTFNVFEDNLRSEFRVPGYVKLLGGSPDENEIDQEEIDRFAKSNKLLTFWEFARVVIKAMDWYNTQKIHRGVLKEWRGRPKPKEATPMDCLRACYNDGWRPGKVSREAIDLTFLPRIKRVVDRGRIQFANEYYEHDMLIKLKGCRLECRYDPLDPGWLMVFDDKRYLCMAEPVEYSSMRDVELASRKIEEKRRTRKGFLLEYKNLTSNIPDFRNYSNIPAVERAAALVGREKKKRLEERKALLVAPSEEELAAKAAQIENYQSPMRRPRFNSDSERYYWTLAQQCEGNKIEYLDAMFQAGYEVQMNASARNYWQTIRDTFGLPEPEDREPISGPRSRIDKRREARKKPLVKSFEERYLWLLEGEAEGEEICAEDRSFMVDFEAGMDERQHKSWRVYRRAVGLPQLEEGRDDREVLSDPDEVRPIFPNEFSRYKWIVRQLIMEKTVLPDDEMFQAKFESSHDRKLIEDVREELRLEATLCCANAS